VKAGRSKASLVREFEAETPFAFLIGGLCCMLTVKGADLPAAAYATAAKKFQARKVPVLSIPRFVSIQP
jgi:hypothetical protein